MALGNADFEDNRALTEDDDELNLLDLVLPYLKFWPYYLGAIVLCLGLAWLFISTQRPLYPVTTSILFMDEKDKQGSQTADDLLAQVTTGVSNVNIDNEIQLIKSREMLEKTVRESRYYVDIVGKDGLGKKVWYGNLPFKISLDDTSLDHLKENASFTLSSLGGGKYRITLRETGDTVDVDKIPGTYSVPFGLLTFEKQQPKDPSVILPSSLDVTIKDPLKVAVSLMTSQLTVERADKQSSVAKMSIQADDRTKGEEFLSKLLQVYNRERAIDKNATAQNTYKFINERIKIIGEELSDIEGRLAGVKQNQGVTSYSDLGVAVQGKAEARKAKAETTSKLNTVNYLLNYVKNSKNQFALIPSTLGLEDQSLAGAVQEYNKMIFERTNLLTTANETHPKVIAQNNVIEKARQNIIDAAEASKVGLEITLSGLEAQDRSYTGIIADAPAFERLAGDIERQRAIRNDLYLMLLTKREETSIQLAASIESARVVDSPLADEHPSSPKKPIIYLVGILLGIILTTLAIYIWRLTQTKIKNEGDIKDLTKLTILGSVPKLEKDASTELMVQTHGNDYTTEVFRNLRTNLSFITGNKQPLVVLVTSTVPAEGKTLVVSNLAVSLSALDKKVLLVGLDIRNPQLARTFGVKNVKKFGITDLLNDPSINTEEFIIPVEGYPNLSLLQTGTIPPNPAEILSRSRLDGIFAELREKYDYIVVDSAPCGPVVDTLVMSRVADATVYVTRAEKTEKKDFDYINYLSDAQKLPNVSILVNGVDFMVAKKRHGKYGHSYGYGYGYDYGYGYGYGKNKEKK